MTQLHAPPGPQEEKRHPPIDVERLKQSIRLSDIVSQHTQLRPSGRSRVGLCPFHGEKNPSFVVTDDLGFYYCHGCQATGDVIDFVKAIHGCGFLDAVHLISGTIPAVTISRYRQQARKVDRARRALAVAYARFQWQEAVHVDGTPAEQYLRLRGIQGEIPPTLRYGRPPLWISNTTGEKGPRHHALIAACQDEAGRLTGVQRIFLQSNGKIASLRRPKLSLGQIKGGALRLGPEAAEMVVCEGPEDGLTLHQLMPTTPVWVALGSGNMASMNLPPTVKRVLVAGDNNPAGRKAAKDACEAFRSQGRDAAPIFPAPEFEDFNDQLRGIRKSEAIS